MPSESKNRIRVLLVSHTLDRGGLEEAVFSTAQGLDKALFDVHVAFFVGGDVATRLARVPGVQSVLIGAPGHAARLLALTSLAREIRPQILHNHYCWHGLPAGVLAGARRVETVHNQYSWLNSVQRTAYGLSCRLAHRMIAVSESVRAYTIERFPATVHKRWDVIHNGINPERYRRSGVPDLRSGLGLKPEHVVVGFSGRLEEEKGVRLLMDAAAIFQKSHSQIRILIVGSGSLNAQLRDSAAARGLTNVIFTGYRNDIARLYSVFDIQVLPSLYEGLPLALLEGMAAGCPVVAFKVGGIPEAVDDGVHGYLVEPGSVIALAECVGRLAVDPERRMAMGRAAEARIAGTFSAGGMITRIQNVYLDLVRRVPQ
jgi:glycosyltransferase involved in cell wall biosynthesis